jgi:hypothetical protein
LFVSGKRYSAVRKGLKSAAEGECHVRWVTRFHYDSDVVRDADVTLLDGECLSLGLYCFLVPVAIVRNEIAHLLKKFASLFIRLSCLHRRILLGRINFNIILVSVHCVSECSLLGFGSTFSVNFFLSTMIAYKQVDSNFVFVAQRH